MQGTIRVLLANEHSLFRAGIRALLEKFDAVEIVGETGDGHEVVEKSKSLNPDVVLIDIIMPGLNGLEVVTRLVRDSVNVGIIVLSVYECEEHVLQVLRSGASGYLGKEASPTELESAIKSVARGELYISPFVSGRAIDKYIRYPERLAASSDKEREVLHPFLILTARQREVLQLIAEGYTTKGIAEKLNLSIKTIKTHRLQLMERLDIHDIAGLVRYAIRVGLVLPDK